MLKKFGGKLLKNTYNTFFVFISAIVFSILYLYKLGSFNRGDSTFENPTKLNIIDHSAVIHDISLFPIKFLEYLMLKIDQPNSTLLRLTSILVLALSFIAFYRLILKWQTHRTAVLATFLFMTSSLSLALGHLTIQSVLYVSVIPSILLMGSWLRSKKYVKRVIFVLPITAVLIYIPGFLFIIVSACIIFKRRLLAAWRYSHVKYRLVGVISATILLMPMFYSLIKYPNQYKKFFGFDRLFDGSFFDTLINIPNQLFWSGIDQPEIWLKGTPVVDIVSAVFLALGIYAYTKSEHTLRARVLAGLAGLSILIISLSSVASVIILLPLIYIFIAKGISYLLQNWFVVFPRNPAARSLGVILIVIPLMLSAGYNAHRYFNAWHNAPQTVHILSIK